MRKRILFFIEDIGIGGQQHFNFTLARYLKNLDNEIYFAYYLDGGFRDLFEAEGTIINIDAPPKDWAKAVKKPFHIIQQAFKLRSIIKENKIDIVISNAPYTYLIAAVTRIMSKAWHVRLLGKEPSKEVTLWKYFTALRFSETTDLFLSFSYANQELSAKGVKPYKLIDAINAVDTDFFKPTLSHQAKIDLKKELNIDENYFVIGWCGRIEKNMEVFNTVEMLKRLLDFGFVKFKFLVIGHGGYFNEFKEHVVNSGLNDHTIYLGWQKPENVRTYLQICDVMPLLDEDPIGGSIVREAMACGVTVLSVNGKRGFQKEWIINNTNGLLVESDNYIEKAARLCLKMYDNLDTLKVLSDNGVKFAKDNLSFETKSKTINYAFDKLLKNEVC